MQKKRVLVMSSLLMAIILLGIGTIAYFRRTVNGNITGNTGNLVLIVNEADAVQNETFSVTLERSETENFIMPDDKGVFNLNIDSTGSTSDVAVTITMSRVNLPQNLKFYLDSNYTQELTTYATVIEKSNDMTMTVPIYWFWDGSINDADDSEFINKTISANISVSASIAKTLYDTLMSYDKTIDTNVDFSQLSSETNGQGLMMMDQTQNDEYSIVYYRGDVNNNNVIYAGYCWLIVRTTETGGTKLIYNGEVNEDGSCTNHSGVTAEGANSHAIPTVVVSRYDAAFIDNLTSVKFNENYKSPVYVGYMYNDMNLYYSSSILDGDGYIAHLSDNTVDSETGRHVQNLKDSTIKGVIDEWYVRNIKDTIAEDLLEDTVWCNDRSVISETYTIENYANGTNTEFYFAAKTRLVENTTVTPSLACSRDIDKFTVDSENGNGDLDYPISMLTADEIALAGSVYALYDSAVLITTYLAIPDVFWALSPSAFNSNGVAETLLMPFGHLRVSRVHTAQKGVRPSVSLNNNTYVTGGNGSFEQPYTVG